MTKKAYLLLHFLIFSFSINANPMYIVHDLGTGVANSLNNNDMVAGNYYSASENGDPVYEGGFLWSLNTDSQDYLMDSNAVLRQINDNGLVIGTYLDESNNSQLFTLESGNTVQIQTQNNGYLDIIDLNNQGQALIVTDTNGIQIWSEDGTIQNVNLPGTIWGINDYLEYSGTTEVNNGNQSTNTFAGYLVDRNNQLMTFSNGGTTIAYDVNNNGVTYGRSRTEFTDINTGKYEAFLYDSTNGFNNLGNFGYQNASIRSLNENNLGVGWGSNTNINEGPWDFIPFLYDHNLGIHYELDDIVNLDGTGLASIDYALQINNKGNIIGYGTGEDGLRHAVFLQQIQSVNSPATSLLILLPLLVLTTKRKRDAS